MYGSKYIGTFLGGAFLSRMVVDGGLGIAFTIQVVMLAGIMLFPLFLRERDGEKLLPWTKGKSQLAVEERLASSVIQLFRFLLRVYVWRYKRSIFTTGYFYWSGCVAIGCDCDFPIHRCASSTTSIGT